MTRPALRRGLLLALLAATALLPPRDVEVGAVESGAVSIGRARLHAGWGAALAQTAEGATLENVTFGAGALTLRAPRVEVRGTALSRADLTALLDPASTEGWAARLAKLNAREIAIPELRVEQSVGGKAQFAVYRDLTARDVAAGRVGRLEAAGAEIRVDGEAAGTGRYGRIRAAEVDMAEIARLYVERAASPGPMRRIYGPFSVEDVSFTDKKGVEVRVARTEGGGFSARPVKDSWAGLTQRLAEAAPGAADARRVYPALAELFDAVESGSLEMSGLTVRDPSRKEPVDVAIARVAYAGAGRPAELRFEGIEVGTPEGRMKLASVVSSGFSLAPTMEGLKALGERTDPVDPADLRRLAPTLGSLRFSNLSFEGKATSGEGAVRIGLRGAEFRAERPVNGVPTESRLSMDGLTVAIPADTKQDGLRDVAALGYRELDLSWIMEVGWSEAARELAVREFSLSGRDMGTARARATIAGIGKDVFDTDTAIAAAALMGASATRLDVTLENSGLYERIVAQQAKAQGRGTEELRRDYAMLAAAGIPAVLGGSPTAKAIGQAVARFAAKPGRLSLTARSKSAAGLGLVDFTTAGDPTAILDLLEVTATAE